jgi:hypothetical protein
LIFGDLFIDGVLWEKMESSREEEAFRRAWMAFCFDGEEFCIYPGRRVWASDESLGGPEPY